MPTVTCKPEPNWQNFHVTLGAPDAHDPRPHLHIKSLASINVDDATQPSGLERFAATGAALFDYLARLEAQGDPASPPSFAAGTVGRGWSFAPLIGTPEAQFDAIGLKGTRMLADAERDPKCRVPAGSVALTSGGTTLNDLANWAETGHGRTVCTSGTFLPPTVAGSIGTASHGSRLFYGGIQNMVLGMHLIVGSDEHVWIEPHSAPVLSEEGLARLAINGTPPRVVRNDEQFEDALVHLGAMGIVNGVALELAPNDRFSMMRRAHILSPEFLETIASGDFQAVARELCCEAPPLFYELTLNPHRPFDYPATHTMYFRTDRAALMSGPADIPHPTTVIIEIGDKIVELTEQAPNDLPVGFLSEADGAIPYWVLPLLINAPSAFDRYLGMKHYGAANELFDPDSPGAPGPYRWTQMHPGEITGDTPGALYNASFSIPLEQLARALPLICEAVQALAPSFVFSVRFVDKACGTLAFTRFEKNAVIEIDGLSPLICMAAKAAVNPDLPYATELKDALDILTVTLPRGAALMRRALDGNGIPYSMHWAKLGDLDKAKVHADYGHPRDPESLIYKWRETRDMLLTPFGKRVFWNDALIAYGLLDV